MLDIRHLALGAAAAATLALASVPASAQSEDCDTMIGQINQLLETAQLTDEQKQQVFQLRDEGMGETTRASGDCAEPLSEALQILQQQ